MLKFPYGISDFHTLITENYFYVDRTHLLPEIEEAGKQLLFLRPRCFGKSLLLSMLENYYDNELTIKTAFLTLLFEDVFYIMDSELPLRRGYADLTMIVRPERRPSLLWDILLEFKYLKLADVKLAGAKRKGPKLRQLSPAALKQLTPVQQQLAAAQAQLTTYRQTLQAKYGGVLRLRCYSVVAVGLERLVWEEVS